MAKPVRYQVLAVALRVAEASHPVEPYSSQHFKGINGSPRRWVVSTSAKSTRYGTAKNDGCIHGTKLQPGLRDENLHPKYSSSSTDGRNACRSRSAALAHLLVWASTHGALYEAEDNQDHQFGADYQDVERLRVPLVNRYLEVQLQLRYKTSSLGTSKALRRRANACGLEKRMGMERYKSQRRRPRGFRSYNKYCIQCLAACAKLIRDAARLVAGVAQGHVDMQKIDSMLIIPKRNRHSNRTASRWAVPGQLRDGYREHNSASSQNKRHGNHAQSDGRDDQQVMEHASSTRVSSWDSTIASSRAVRYAPSLVPLERCRQASRTRDGIPLPNSRNQAPNPATQGVRDTPGTARAVGAPRVNWLVVGLLPLAAADDSWGCL
ncbi:hypothetical protein N5P37_000704 [Trichoderma harzianum]|nr:hypothetical protein N5P37_000704 [Trichoderma harzianum]